MKHINRFFNLDEYSKVNNITKEDVNTEYDNKGHKIITINNKKYYLKPSVYPLYEVLGSLIARTVDINTANYIPVIYKGEECVISPYFHKDENKYIRGDILLYRAKNDYTLVKELFPKADYKLRDINSLDIIWLELIRLYPEANLEQVMNDFIDKFFLTILLKNFDYIGINWEIEVESDKNLKVMPYYDYEFILTQRNDIHFTAAFGTDTKSGIEVLKKFISISDTKYIKRLKEIINILTPEKIIEIMKEIESTYNEEIPEKEIIIEEYTKNYNQITHILMTKEKSL